MKKLFFALALAVTSVAAWADRWTAPTSTTYPDETPLYVTVTVDDNSETHVPTVTEIAAFIDGECRAQATQLTGSVYVLRVRGGQADQGKTITIKALYNGLVYKFNRTETFDGEADTHDVPLALTLHPLREITVDENPIEMTVGETYDVSEHVNYVYGLGESWTDETGAVSYAGVPESDRSTTIDEEETPLTVRYDAGNAGDFLSVDENGVLTALQVTSGISFGISVEGPADETGFRASFSLWPQVVISLPVVKEIVVNPTELTVYVGDNFNTLIEDGTLSISMLPENADQNYRISTQGAAFPYDGDGYFTEAGDFELLVYSTDNSELDPVTLTIHVKAPLSFSVTEEAYAGFIGTLRPMEFNLYFNSLEDFDASKLSIDVTYPETAAPAISYSIGDVAENGDDESLPYYVPVTLTGRYVGEVYYVINYDGEPVMDEFYAVVVPEVKIQNGWQWVSPYAYQEGWAAEIYNYENESYTAEWLNDLVEMRTQEGLLYNDPTLGIFGDITDFHFMNGMYKVKSKADGEFVLRLGDNLEMWQLASMNDGSNLRKGYNWVVYPFEFPLKLSEVEGGLNDYASEGDQIISKDGGFVEFSEGEWVGGEDFTFQPGVGYIYYYNNEEWEGQFALYFDLYEMIPEAFQEGAAEPAAPVRRKAQARQHGWTVDATRFADNMTLVASLSLPKDNRYVIGAFVDGECRGTGSMVKDGIAFISVAGKSGERVTFRLLDSQTGETFDIDQHLNYTQKAGSLKAPISLTSEYTTGISTIDNGKLTNDDAVVYDLNGRRVERPAKGVYIVNGKKVLF